MEKNKQKQTNIFTVQSEQTIISFLKKTFNQTPLSLIYKLIRTKKVILQNKQIRYYHHRLRENSVVVINDEKFLNEWTNKPQKMIKQKIVLPLIKSVVIYEDQNVLIVVKEHNVEMHNEINKEKTLDNEIAYYLANSSSVSDHLFIFSSAHRIDKLTRGIVVYPKNSLSKRILHNSFGKKELIKKSYLAVCENKTIKKKIPSRLDGYIYKDELEEKMIFHPLKNEKKEGKFCSMKIEEISSNSSFLLLEIILNTGRKHQIRSSLSYLGLPIVGDKKYGSTIFLENKIKLFAYKLEFLNLPAPLNYLNNKTFEINRLRKKLLLWISSSFQSTLPRKFLKY